MNRFVRILSIVLASVMIVGILVCGVGCGRKPDSPNTPQITNNPTSNGSFSTDSSTSKPSSGTEASKDVPLENWGIDAQNVVFTINLSGEAHEYTAGELFAMGASIIKAPSANSMSDAKEMKGYSGITIEKLFADLNIDLGTFAPSSFVLVGSDGHEHNFEDRLSEIDLGACIVAFSVNNKPLERNGAYFVSVPADEAARPSVTEGIVSIDIVQ